jgi:hypothetical protein
VPYPLGENENINSWIYLESVASVLSWSLCCRCAVLSWKALVVLSNIFMLVCYKCILLVRSNILLPSVLWPCYSELASYSSLFFLVQVISLGIVYRGRVSPCLDWLDFGRVKLVKYIKIYINTTTQGLEV